jgi:hypothetical protein
MTGPLEMDTFSTYLKAMPAQIEATAHSYRTYNLAALLLPSKIVCR